VTPSRPSRSGNRLHALLRRVEAAEALDPVADRLARVVVALTRPVEAKPLLTGTWLGHAVHPVLTDFADGAWMAGSFLDLFGPPRSALAARRLVGFGLLCAVPTALSGLGEWVDTRGKERRVGLLHAATSTAAFSLYGCSYLARRSNRQLAAATLGVVGGLVAIADGYVGGHLTLALGVGVGRTAFDELPDQWTPTVLADDLPEGRPTRVLLGTAEIVLVRSAGRLFALANRCTYRGAGLHQGTLRGDTIICPGHGCVFRLDDGAVLGGPASIPQPSLESRVAHGRVEVRVKDVLGAPAPTGGSS
jgi:nitrite reductase/ring-hydroxylating ferredoxin subunit